MASRLEPLPKQERASYLSRMAKAAKRRAGDKIGAWKLEEYLGGGGNGVVWRASQAGRPDHAIKILRNLSQIAQDRLIAEIEGLNLAHGIEGVIPLVEHELPYASTKSARWFVMPLATPYSVDGRVGAKSTVRRFLPLAETLAKLHEREIYHRDIKPANLLQLNGRLCFSDFGLVKYPQRPDLTPDRVDVGAKFTMAPEMRREAAKAAGGPADVYSFAKTLWIALTGQIRGFDGQYSASGALALRHYQRDIFQAPLDKLLTECTDNDPAARPVMAEVALRLANWLAVEADFHRRNLSEWIEVQNRLFPQGSPTRATWTGLEDIINVLREVSSTQGLNHMFMPDGGGLAISHVEAANEHGFLKLDGGVCVVLKPSKLTFESFGAGSIWNYFRLEAEAIKASGTEGAYEPDNGYKEVICEITPGSYVGIDAWDDNEYEDEPLPAGAHPLSRYLKGSFVLFSTRSHYNLDSKTYDARHERKGEEAFRTYIQEQKRMFDAEEEEEGVFDGASPGTAAGSVGLAAPSTR